MYSTSLSHSFFFFFFNDTATTEIYTLSLHDALPIFVSPQWRVDFSGFPAVLPDDLAAAPWVFEYRPRVGEQLELAVTRPQAVAGRTLAIDAVHQRARIGRHSSEHELELRYRSTQGSRHAIQLPKEGSVTQVAVDGEPTQIRPDGGELPLSLLPGKHTVRIAWRSKDGDRKSVV